MLSWANPLSRETSFTLHTRDWPSTMVEPTLPLRPHLMRLVEKMMLFFFGGRNSYISTRGSLPLALSLSFCISGGVVSVVRSSRDGVWNFGLQIFPFCRPGEFTDWNYDWYDYDVSMCIKTKMLSYATMMLNSSS